MRLEQALAAAAIQEPDKTAFAVCGGASIGFAELARRSDRAAAWLLEQGVRSGDRVGIVSDHDVDAVVLFWGVLKAGAVVVWLNVDAAAPDLAHVVDNAGFRFIAVQSEKLGNRLEKSAASLPSLLPLDACSEPSGSAIHAAPEADDQADDRALASIVYTSGSSGRPKGVCLSHRNLAAVAQSVVQHMPISSRDSYLMVVPLHYIHGLMQLLVHTLAVATVYCERSFVFPRKVVDTLRSTGATGFSGVPFHFNSLITRGGFLDASLPDLKWLTVTGGKLPADTIHEILEHHPDVSFHVAYGQTECSPRATALRPERVRGKAESVGSPIPGVEVLLLDDAGNEVEPGEVGEVVIAGDNVMLGYWQDEAATAEVLDSEGRLHTGDLGRFDADGDLFLVGRKSAMIKSAGERIIPEEIERVLESSPRVKEAVVVGVPDPLYGQRVVAHVLLADAAGSDNDETIAALRAHCLERIPLPRAPREYRIWADFPRRANGKPDRPAIAEVPGDPAHSRPE